MDYKYILQLLDRYWEGDTSLEEEHILHIFFSQSDIPAELEQYRPFFVYAAKQQDEHLSADFDNHLLAMIGEEPIRKSPSQRLHIRLMPLFRAVAVVAIILTLSNAAQIPYQQQATMPMQITNTDADGLPIAFTLPDSTTVDSLQRTNLTMPQVIGH